MSKSISEADRGTAVGQAEFSSRIVLVLLSVVLSLVLLELGCRALLPGPATLTRWPNIVRERMSIHEDGGGPCAQAYDAQLGWTTPHICNSESYSVDGDGFRVTPATRKLSGTPVLATGSSFAFGEEVTDGEAWPAYLQNLAGRKVLNGGVSGYSLDQTVLRTEQLAARRKPAVIVASFTPNDVRRTELKVSWSREKPYFAVIDGKLELRNVPVPGEPNATVPLPLAARLFGRSALADELARALGIYEGWYYFEVQATAPGSGDAISCLLMPRLAALGVPVMLVAEYSRGHWTADAAGKARDLRTIGKLFDCARAAGLSTFDLAAQLGPIVEARGLDTLYRSDHHSSEGNRVVAELILRELVSRGLLPPSAEP